MNAISYFGTKPSEVTCGACGKPFLVGQDAIQIYKGYVTLTEAEQELGIAEDAAQFLHLHQACLTEEIVRKLI